MTRKAQRFPGDLAAREFSELAQALRADAGAEHGERRMRGYRADVLRLAADALDALATGNDPRALIDWRKKAMPMLRAVEAVHDAVDAGAQTWVDAIGNAAAALGVCPRTIERHFARWLAERGMVRADYLLFPG